jgi:hypothetical protein
MKFLAYKPFILTKSKTKRKVVLVELSSRRIVEAASTKETWKWLKILENGFLNLISIMAKEKK